MKYTYTIGERTFHFIHPAGTSRGVYRKRLSWIVTLRDEVGHKGLGECAPLPNLSCDDLPEYRERLEKACHEVAISGQIDIDALRPYPSILFGLETALLHLKARSTTLFDTPFSRGEEGIPINGLVWMGSFDEMLERMKGKLAEGFHCIKLKIGAIDFEREVELLRRLRAKYPIGELQIRVDANGGFAPEEALKKLEILAKYGVHSIEQPIRQGQWSKLSSLCRQSPVPIALDEELIGVNAIDDKTTLLDTVNPQYIVLKPSLHGGFSGTREWIEIARERGIGSWITSALEGNIGLNAVAQLAADAYGPGITFPQGLGTGALYSDNISMPIEIKGEHLWYSKNS